MVHYLQRMAILVIVCNQWRNGWCDLDDEWDLSSATWIHVLVSVISGGCSGQK